MTAQHKSYEAMRVRVESRAAAEAIGAVYQPSNVDPIEVASVRKRREERPLTIRDGDAREVLAALKGKPADKTLPAGTAPTGPTDRPLLPAEVERASLLAQVVSLAGLLKPDDLRVLVWILECLPFTRLVERCTEITIAASEPANTPNNYQPTSAEHVALAGLLSAWRGVRLLVLGRRGR